MVYNIVTKSFIVLCEKFNKKFLISINHRFLSCQRISVIYIAGKKSLSTPSHLSDLVKRRQFRKEFYRWKETCSWKVTIPPFTVRIARDVKDKTEDDRKIRHGHSGVARRKFVFNTAEPCPNALVLSFSPSRPPHGNDTRERSFYFQDHL